MREVEYFTEILHKKMCVKIIKLDTGYQITVGGGDCSHIGAVSVVDEIGKLNTIELCGHRESVITEKWAKRIYIATCEPVAVTMGLHYDHISEKSLMKVILEMDLFLERILKKEFK